MGFNITKIFKKKNNEVVDLGKLHQTNQTVSNINQNQPETTKQEQGLGFIGNLASASESDIEEIKTDIDPEKINRFGRRLDRLLGRLELIERKIERIEHRMDIS